MIIYALGGVELVQELPFVGSVRPPDEAAVETMFWRPYGAGKPVSSTSTVGSQLPMFCQQTQYLLPPVDDEPLLVSFVESLLPLLLLLLLLLP